METVYFNEYAMSQILKELYQIEVGQTAFLQVKDKNILKDLKINILYINLNLQIVHYLQASMKNFNKLNGSFIVLVLYQL